MRSIAQAVYALRLITQNMVDRTINNERKKIISIPTLPTLNERKQLHTWGKIVDYISLNNLKMMSL